MAGLDPATLLSVPVSVRDVAFPHYPRGAFPSECSDQTGSLPALTRDLYPSELHVFECNGRLCRWADGPVSAGSSPEACVPVPRPPPSVGDEQWRSDSPTVWLTTGVFQSWVRHGEWDEETGYALSAYRGGDWQILELESGPVVGLAVIQGKRGCSRGGDASPRRRGGSA